jgi:Flp pilus assembly protein TadG
MKRGQKGSEILEFSLVLLPMLAGCTALLDTGWAIFTMSTLQRAVRVGVTSGTTLTAAQIPSGCLTDTVKSIVQQNALGLLSGSTGLNSIKVNYLVPPDPGSTAALTDVSSQSDGNSPGNIMQVSVNFSLVPLIPRIVSWNDAPDNTVLPIKVYSGGVIEPSDNPPCIGTAP